MSAKTITFEAPEEIVAKIDGVAANLGVDRAEVLREAITLYLADDEELQATLAESIRQADAGETISHEEVMAEHSNWKAAAQGREAA